VQGCGAFNSAKRSPVSPSLRCRHYSIGSTPQATPSTYAAACKLDQQYSPQGSSYQSQISEHPLHPALLHIAEVDATLPVEALLRLPISHLHHNHSYLALSTQASSTSTVFLTQRLLCQSCSLQQRTQQESIEWQQSLHLDYPR
jgi:hypothetical protein